jgi:hypothetical protein
MTSGTSVCTCCHLCLERSTTEGMGHHLAAEADAEDRNAPSRRLLQHRHFCAHPVGDLGPVHAPLATEQQQQFVSVELWPFTGVLAVALVEGVAMFTEPLADEPGIGVGSVGDEKGAHGETVPALRWR